MRALQANGEVVAMTGDGVNDAPALKAAHIGVAMGKRGSDVAREASALVLLEDDFTSLVEAVRLGRRIYTNIRSAMRYIIAVHVPTAGLALVPIVLDWPLVLFPVHVVFLEFVIDPACSVVFEGEPAERAAMRRPPRRRDARLFDAEMIMVGIAQGLVVLMSTLVLYGWATSEGLPEAEARAMAFASLVFGNVALVFANRPHAVTFRERLASDNKALWWLTGGALGGLVAVLYVEPLSTAFRFAPPATAHVALAALAGVSGLLLLAAGHLLFPRRRARAGSST